MPAKTPEMPGMERTSIPEIDDSAQAYVSARDKRMALTSKEVAAKLNLLTVLQAHEKELDKGQDGAKVYRFEDEIVILKPGKLKVQVKHANEEDEEEDE
jgi:hypothetical protein